MKTILIMLLALCTFSLFAQTVSISVEYQINESLDSAYILLWKGTETKLCPLVEDTSFSNLDLSTLIVSSINLRDSIYNFNLPADMETFKLGAVAFKSNFASDMSTTAFYQLPGKPGKIIFGPLIFDSTYTVGYGYLWDENNLWHLPNGDLPRRENRTYLYQAADWKGRLIEYNYIKHYAKN